MTDIINKAQTQMLRAAAYIFAATERGVQKDTKAPAEILREALEQAAMELDEAAKIIHGFGRPRVASLFMTAADKHRTTARARIKELEGKT